MTLETTSSQPAVRPRSLAGPSPSPPHARPAGRAEQRGPDWSQVLRALRGTDEDDLPLFGRLPA